MATVIIGGGICGCASAYFLKECGVENVVVLERWKVAGSASGKAGGFLARGWGNAATRELHEKGFDLHAKLAVDLGLESYRKIPCYQSGGRERSLPWLNGGHRMTDTDCAQVEPKELTETLLKHSGAKVVIGKAVGLRRNADGAVDAVKLDNGGFIECAKVLIAMGAWSCEADEWFENNTAIPMEGIKSSSLIYQEAITENPAAIFCSDDKNGCHLEIYPRPDGSVYFCGLGGSPYLSREQLPAPEDVQPEQSRVPLAQLSVEALMGFKTEPRAQACLRPILPDAYPMMAAIEKNVFVCSGHNCWGILWGPISGKIMADLMTKRETSMNISAFRPRFEKR